MEKENLFLQYKKNGLTAWRENFYNIDYFREIILDTNHIRISNLFKEDKNFVNFLESPTLKYLLDKIYKEYHLTTFSSNTLKKENKDERFFHVDYPYHNLKSPYPDEILGIQVIYALDDFTYENGATMYFPDSFKSKEFPRKDSIYAKQNLEYITVPKGSVILFRGDLWHSQGINRTDNPRVAILANFSPLNIPAKDNIVEQVKSSETNLKIKKDKVLI